MILSVITPVYNCEKYINESIDSVLSQSFTDFEFIIVNDGSSDKTRDIVLSYSSDNRIIFLDNNDNKKIPTRRNEAIKEAKGKYLAIHDGDDISLPFRFEEQVNYLEKYNNLFCVGGHADKIDLSGIKFGEMTYPPESNIAILEMIIKKCMNPIIDPTTIFRRDIFNLLEQYTLDQSIYTVPDFDLWLKAISNDYLFNNIQRPLIKYRQNPNGMTGKHKDEMIKSHMKVWMAYMRRLIIAYNRQREHFERQDKLDK